MISSNHHLLSKVRISYHLLSHVYREKHNTINITLNAQLHYRLFINFIKFLDWSTHLKPIHGSSVIRVKIEV
jgi:hypothetical protein